MLTFGERIKMYKGKKLFVETVSKAFEEPTLYSNVKKVEYEVYSRYNPEFDTTYYAEFIVVTFTSDAKSVRTVTGTSNNGIFVEIGKLINGGYYEELDYYNKVVSCSDKLNLED
jgi:hypothetical protein